MNNKSLLQHYCLEEQLPEAWNETDDEATDFRISAYGGGGSINTQEPADDMDPLGIYKSINAVLNYRNMSIDQHAQQYYVSSADFNPKTFLRDIHNQSRYDDLREGFQNVSYSLQNSAADFSELYISNFDKCVETKRTVDGLYDELQKTLLPRSPTSRISRVSQPIAEATHEATALYRSILANRIRSEKISRAIDILGKNRPLLQIPSTLEILHFKKDYARFIEEYHSARNTILESKETRAAEIEDNLVLNRVDNNIDRIVDRVRQAFWSQLRMQRTGPHYLDTISMLLRLGVEQNPISFVLRTEFEHLKTTFITLFDTRWAEIEELRVKVMNRKTRESRQIVWTAVEDTLVDIISRQQTSIVNFNKEALGFLERKTQKVLPVGFRNESRIHLTLSKDETEEIYAMPSELAGLLLKYTVAVFSGLQVTEISNSALASMQINESGSLNFLPPSTDAQETSTKLGRLVPQVYKSISPLANILISDDVDEVKVAMNKIRTACVATLCRLWQNDGQHFKCLENWKRSAENRDITQLPMRFYKYQTAVTNGFQELLFRTSSIDGKEISDLQPPSQTLVSQVRAQFIKCLYRLFEDLVKVANWQEDAPSQTPITPSIRDNELSMKESIIDCSDIDSKMILTLSNMCELRNSVVPRLLEQFENAFSIDLTQESRIVHDVLNQLDDKVFAAYSKRKMKILSDIVTDGASQRANKLKSDAKPTGVSHYILETLLSLALVHAQVSSVSKSQLHRVVGDLFERILNQYLEQYRSVDQVSNNGMLQATLDVEFTQQTLSYYCSKRTKETIQTIYATLEQSRNHNFSQTDFQRGLSDIKDILQASRRSTYAQLLCFRKPKDGGDRSRTGGDPF